MAVPIPLGPIHTAEYHTAGEPFRIVTGGVPDTEGATVLDRRTWAQQHLEDVRALLVNEPRGHADMYGGFVTPPDDDDGDLGVIFFHKDGFSTACGHGTIALATWAIEARVIKTGSGAEAGSGADADRPVDLVIDVPSGRLRVEVAVDEAGRVDHVRFWNVDSFVTARAVSVETSYGPVEVDVSFGGAFYGSVPLDGGLGGIDGVGGVSGLSGLGPGAGHLTELIDLARQVKTHFVDHPAVTHADPRLSGMYGVIFHQDLEPDPGGTAAANAVLAQRNVTVFADGEVDRSPCGSGTSARLAVLQAQGRLTVGQTFHNHGVAGGRFDARIEAVTVEGSTSGGEDRVLVATSVAGSAYRTGQSTFTVDPRDTIGLGFQLR